MALIAGKDILTVAIAQGATPGTLDIVTAPNVAARVYVVNFGLGTPAATTLKFQSGTGPTDITGAMNIPANGFLYAGGNSRDTPLFATGKGEKLTIVTVGAGSGANGWLTYFIGQHGGI